MQLILANEFYVSKTLDHTRISISLELNSCSTKTFTYIFYRTYMIAAVVEPKLQFQLRLQFHVLAVEATVQWAGAVCRSAQNSCSLCNNYSNKDVVKTNIRNGKLHECMCLCGDRGNSMCTFNRLLKHVVAVICNASCFYNLSWLSPAIQGLEVISRC